MFKLKKYFQAILTFKEKLILFYCFILSLFAVLIETLGISLIPSFIYSILEPDKTLNILKNFISKDVLNSFYHNSQNTNQFFAIIILVLFVIKNITLYIITTTISFSYLRIREGISYRFQKWFIKSSYRDYLNFNSSKIIRDVTIETANASSCLRDIIFLINELLLILFIIFFSSFSLPLNFILATGFIGLITIIFLSLTKSKVKKWGALGVYQRDLIIKYTSHIFNSFKELKIFKNEVFLLQKYKKSLSHHFSLIKKVTLISNLAKYLIEISAVSIILLSTLILLQTENNLESHLFTLSFFAAALIKLIPSFNKINTYYIKIQSNQKSVETIFNLRKLVNNILKTNFKNNKSGIFLESLEFKNVSFKYESRNKTLENINFKINKNQITFIKGKSGSGKSTLVDLICGLINPDNGTIFLNNKKIDNSDNIYIDVSYMPQKIYLLDDTIKNNIIFGNYKNINEDSIKKIINDVGLQDFINTLPNNLNEFIGENAKKLSGGQIKRIGLARSLYKDKKTLILDEPTSGLDDRSSQEIIKLLKNLSINKNIFIISHNESFEDISDHILECKDFTVKQIK